MEILICTVSKPLWKKLFSLTDSFLCHRKSRYMSVSYNLFMTEKTILDAVKNHKSAIVILDVQSFDDWQKIAEEIEVINRSVRICLVSSTSESAINAINCLKTICGYLCKCKLDKMFEDVFLRLYGKIRTVCQGIAITHYNCIDKIIPFEDIFFIETVKQTHMCTIVHKNGKDEIRVNISKLIKELPDIFQIVRSSVIANISEIKAISDCEMFFPNQRSCFGSKKFMLQIPSFIKQPILY